MATTGSVSKRAMVVATIMIIASGCTASTTSSSAASETATSIPPTSTPSQDGHAVKAVTDPLEGARYRFGPFGDPSASFTISAKGPNGWTGYPDWAMDGPSPLRADAPNGIGLAFFTADRLFSDPCHWDWNGTGEADVGDVKVGPGVNDMVAALRENAYYTSTAAKPVIIDGHSGKELTLQLPDESFTHCDKDDPSDSGGHVFVFSGSGLYAQGPANRWHVYLLDVHGTRLIATVLSYAKTPRSDIRTAENVVKTLHVEE
jgi:hypothetical protein